MPSANTELYLFPLILDTFHLFSFLIVVARIPNTMLNRSGESGHPCLVPEFSGEVLSFTQLSIILAVVYHKWLLLCWDMFLYTHFGENILSYDNVVCFSKIIFHNVMRVFCVTKSTSTTVVSNWEYNTDSDLQNQNF